MSNTVDERVVSMQFDNRHFEQNVQTTMSTLDKLKAALRLDGSAKAAQSEFESYSSGFLRFKDSINKMWASWEYDIAFRMKSIVKSLTVDPVKMGYNEYELKMGSIQTIMSSTGESLETVNKYLGELNEYSDKTIYSFQDMTSNIGKFTNAGVNLEDAVAAIKGVSNVAAVSGANANEASRAMYNFAQALSSGYVKLIDWKSIENANMATVEFKNQLLEAAAAEGKLTKMSDGTYKTLKGTVISATKNFNDSLQEQWMTSDVLIGTLKDYADETTEIGKKAAKAATEVKTFTQLFDTLKESAQSGWAQTWEILVGDFNEAKGLLAGINDVVGGWIGKMADARNELLENWKVLGGRDDLIQAFKNLFEGLKSIVTPIKEAFRDIFPPMTAERLAGFTAGLKDLFAKLKLSDKASENLKRTFKGLFALLDIGKKVISFIFKIFGKILGVTDDVAGGILSITAVIGDWLVKINEAIENCGLFESVLGFLSKTIKLVASVAVKLFNVLRESFIFRVISGAIDMFVAVLTNAEDKIERFKNAVADMKDAWVNSGLYKFLSGLWKIIKSIVTGIAKLFTGLVDSIANAFGSGDFAKGFEIINAILTGGVLTALGIFVKKLIDFIKGPKEFLDSFKDIFENVGNSIQSFTNKIRSQTLKNIAIAIAILAASLILLSFIDEDKLANALAAMTLAFTELMIALKVLNGLDGKKATMKIGTAIALGISLLFFASVIKKLGALDWPTLGKGLVGLTGVLALLVGSQILLSKFGGNSKGIKGVITLSIGLLIISGVIAILGSMSWERLGKGMLGILGILAMLTTAQILMSKLGGSPAKMLAASVSITIMASALTKMIPILLVFALLPLPMVIKSIAALGIVLGGLAAAQILMTNLAKGGKRMLAAAVSIAIMATSLNMLIPILTLLALLPLQKVAQAVVSLNIILLALVGTQTIMGKLSGSTMLKASTSIAIMAASLNLLLPILLTLALLPMQMLMKSVISFAAILAVLVFAQKAMRAISGAQMIKAAAGIAVMALALNLLVPPLLLLSMMNFKGLIISLAAIAGVFVILGLAALILKPLAPTILLLAGALALLGVAVMAFGAGLILIGAGLVSLGKGLIVLVGGLVAVAGEIGLVATGLVVLISSVIEGIILGIGKGIVAVCKVLIDSIDVIKELLRVLILALCDVLVEMVPNLVSAVLQMVTELLSSLAKFVPQIVEALVDLLVGIIDALAAKMPKIMKSITNLYMSMIRALFQAISEIEPGELANILATTRMMAEIMLELAAMVVLTPFAMAGVVGMGLVVTELAIVLAAIGLLASIPGLTWLAEKGVSLMALVGKAIGSLIGGIVGSVAETASKSLPKIGENLSEFMKNAKPFLESVHLIDEQSLTGMDALVDLILKLTKANVLDGLTRWFTGGSALSNFGADLAAFAPNLRTYSDEVSQLNTSAIIESIDAAKALFEMSEHLPKSGSFLTNLFGGDKGLSRFGSQLSTLGTGMKDYGEAVKDIDSYSIIESSKAAGALADLCSNMPEFSAIEKWFGAKTSISTFSKELVALGSGLVGFSNEVSGAVDSGAVKIAVDAATAIVDMTNKIPNENGIKSWFKGDSAIASYGEDLVKLGQGLAGFAAETSGIKADSMTAAVQAASILADMTNKIPNENGIKSWFTGDSALANYSEDIVKLGEGLVNFSNEVSGLDGDSIIAAATAASALADMTAKIPKKDGIKSWFTGDTAIANFGQELVDLGKGLKDFSVVVTDINPEAVAVASEAAKNLAVMFENIPREDGMASWIKGNASISKFGSDLIALGEGLKGFSDRVIGIKPNEMRAASESAKYLAEMSASLPKQGGVSSWIGGSVSVTDFAKDLPELGNGLKSFSDSVAGINPENVVAAADATKALAEMASYLPKTGGVASWFAGDEDISNFTDKLPALGRGLKHFSDSARGIDVAVVSTASEAARAIAEMCDNTLSRVGEIPELGNNLGQLGSGIKICFANIGSISPESLAMTKSVVSAVVDITNIDFNKVKSLSDSLNNMTTSFKELSSIPENSTDGFSKALSDMGKVSANALLNEFKNIKVEMQTAGDEAIASFITGVTTKLPDVKTAINTVVTASTDAINEGKDSFATSGGYLVEGFASGITTNSFKAVAAAQAMAAAALAAANAALGIESPSKAFMESGAFVDEGFAIGINKYSSLVSDSAGSMATEALNTVSDTISRISEAITNDVDSQPTIRPVLDLTDVESGINSMGGLFNDKTSIGVLANVGAISHAMSKNGQNGETARLASEIDKLNKNLEGMEHTTYNINGINYTESSDVEDAFKTIIRTAKIERRT